MTQPHFFSWREDSYGMVNGEIGYKGEDQMAGFFDENVREHLMYRILREEP
jgi:hypothetical protein